MCVILRPESQDELQRFVLYCNDLHRVYLHLSFPSGAPFQAEVRVTPAGRPKRPVQTASLAGMSEQAALPASFVCILTVLCIKVYSSNKFIWCHEKHLDFAMV